jgi:CHAT domain
MAISGSKIMTATEKLLNFDLAIEALGTSYRARVVASPAGEAVADFTLPFTNKDLQILVLSFRDLLGRARRRSRRIGSEERFLLEDFGGQLFDSVFSGDVGACFSQSRVLADSRGAGLRIRLRLAPDLVNLPWECLLDREFGFVGLAPETVLVRYPELPRPVKAFSISPPLRILAMISSPSDLPALEGDEEWAKLRASLDGLVREGSVQVDRLEGGGLAALQRPLRLNQYHVLHFIGHGMYDDAAEDGALAVERQDGKMRLVTGRDLGLMIRGHRSLRLVVLNACDGARSSQDDPFGGVAQALVRQGIPAVIAMQFEISDAAAVAFSASFYQAIADGLPVDVAIGAARLAMFADGNELEWATPVLHLRSPDGRVFTRGGAVVTPGFSRDKPVPAPRGAESAQDDEYPPIEPAVAMIGLGFADAADEPDQSGEDIGLIAAPVLTEVHEPAVLGENPALPVGANEIAGPASHEEKQPDPAADAATGQRTDRPMTAHKPAWRGTMDGAARDRRKTQGKAERKARAQQEADLLAAEARARALGAAGNPAAARDQLASLLELRERASGLKHPASLVTRHNLAYWTGQAGDAVAARDQFAVLLRMQEEAAGPEDPRTLSIRSNLAFWTGQAGDPAAARDLFAALVPVQERVSGAKHRETLVARRELARWTGEAGDAAGARDQFENLLPVARRAMGAAHPVTLRTRSSLAEWTGKAGDATAARDQFTALLPVINRTFSVPSSENLEALAQLAHWSAEAANHSARPPVGQASAWTGTMGGGPADPEQVSRDLLENELRNSEEQANATGTAGNAAAARDQLAALRPVREMVSGPEHPATLATRRALASWTGEAGDASAARDQFAALLPLQDRVAGAADRATLAVRRELARWTGEAGDRAAAQSELAALLPEAEKILGSRNQDTRTIRRLLQSQAAGETPHQ